MFVQAPVAFLANHIRLANALASGVVASFSAVFVAQTGLAVLQIDGIPIVKRLAEAARLSKRVVEATETFSGGGLA